MRVLKINELKEAPMDTATPIAGWTGGAVSRTRQAVIGDGQSDNFRCNVVNFRVGATTGWHVHDCDQILVVTAGKGFAATETEQREISVGDIVHFKAGERLWHGASADSRYNVVQPSGCFQARRPTTRNWPSSAVSSRPSLATPGRWTVTPQASSVSLTS